jgi:hypothetical protein
MQSETLSKPVQ